MFTQVDYVMIVVSDMARSVAFYRDMIGLPLKFQSPEWTEFQTGSTTLALHGGGAPPPPRGEHGTPYAGTCSIGFTVEDLETTYEDLKAQGVTFIMPPTRRESEGIELAVCLDPDGLPISLAEMLSQAS